MGYLEKTLQPGEQVVYQTRIHWIIYVPPFLLLLLGVVILLWERFQADNQVIFAIGGLIFIVGVVQLLGAWIRWISTEMAITNRRVMAKFGFIWRKTYEIDRSKVEGVYVDQTIMGRLFDYGTLTVTGTGSSSRPIKDVDSPLEFRGKLLAG